MNMTFGVMKLKYLWLKANKLYLFQIRLEGVGWIHLALGKGHVTACWDQGNERSVSIKFELKF
jgi:hypothetical protein